LGRRERPFGLDALRMSDMCYEPFFSHIAQQSGTQCGVRVSDRRFFDRPSLVA
jgi:hypothetical protein